MRSLLKALSSEIGAGTNEKGKRVGGGWGGIDQEIM